MNSDARSSNQAENPVSDLFVLCNLLDALRTRESLAGNIGCGGDDRMVDCDDSSRVQSSRVFLVWIFDIRLGVVGFWLGFYAETGRERQLGMSQWIYPMIHVPLAMDLKPICHRIHFTSARWGEHLNLPSYPNAIRLAYASTALFAGLIGGTTFHFVCGSQETKSQGRNNYRGHRPHPYVGAIRHAGRDRSAVFSAFAGTLG